MSFSVSSARPPISQMSPQERRAYLAALDPASRKQAEQVYGGKDDKAVKPAASASAGS
jgi:hypothetical protein